MTEHEYTPPTLEQLVNFAAVRLFGPGATPDMKDSIRAAFNDGVLGQSLQMMWRQNHKEFQEAAWELRRGSA